MYVVVREDLNPGMQLAQSCHATFAFSQEFPIETDHWMKNSNYICCLSGNTYQIGRLIEEAKQSNIKCSIFKEPDLNDQITAIALEPSLETKRLCSNLKLALKDRK